MPPAPSGTEGNQTLEHLTILLIEDAIGYARTLKRALEWLGFEVFIEHDLHRAVEQAQVYHPDVVLLDLIWPGERSRDALGMVIDLHHALPSVPVLMLTGAEDDEVKWDKVEHAKPDGFIKKSSSVSHLAFEIRHAYKTAKASPQVGEPMRIGELLVDLAARLIMRGDQEIQLAKTEYQLFELLARRLKQWCRYETICAHLWPEEDDVESRTDSIHTYISEIRRKIGSRRPWPYYIENKAGEGYRLVDPGPAPEPMEDDDEI